MKKISLLCITFFVHAIFFYGCSEEDGDAGQRKEMVIYACGYYNDHANWNKPCYWVNGEFRKLPVPEDACNSKCLSVTVYDNRVYALGYYIKTNTTGVCCYWVDGVRTDIPDLYTDGTITNAIAVSEGKVYIPGIRNDNNGGSKFFCYWVDGDIQPLLFPEGALCYSINSASIAVLNGKVCVAVNYSDESRLKARYWVNGVGAELVPSENNHTVCSSIALDGDKVYIGGYCQFISENYYRNACYWVNGERFDVVTPLSSYGRGMSVINAITISGGTTYSAGYCAYPIQKACYWKNEMLKILSVPEDGHAAFCSSIAVFNGKVYTGGYYEDYGRNPVACYWVDGERVDLQRPVATYAECLSIVIAEK